MVYKRFITRGERKFGPYYYESYRDKDGVVRTRQVPAPAKKFNFKFLFFGIGIFVLLISGIFLAKSFLIAPTAKVISSLSPENKGVKDYVYIESSTRGEDTTKVFYDKVIASTAGKIYSFITGFVAEDKGSKEEAKEEVKQEKAEEKKSEESVEGVKEKSAGELIEEVPEERKEEILEESEDISESKETESNETVVEEIEIILNETEEQNKTGIEISNETEQILQNETVKEKVKEKKKEEIVSNVTEEQNVSVITGDVSTQISTSQYEVVLGKPVKWEKKVKVEIKSNEVLQNLSIELPKNSGNISVKKIDGTTGAEETPNIEVSKDNSVEEVEPNVAITGGVISNSFRAIMSATGKIISVIEEENSVVVNVEEEIGNGDEIVVEYYTRAPYAEENVISSKKKGIKVVGPDEVHYGNILAFTELPSEVGVASSVALYWNVNGTRQAVNFEIQDLNNNSLYDAISWIVPYLSEQDYELEINILNVQSYPVVGGEWEVRFSTIGIGDLSIRAVQGTTWSNVDETEDLKFLRLMCGETILNYEWIDDAVFVANYSCDAEGSEFSKVLTEGVHVLEFNFGGQVAYAYNFAITNSNSSVPQTLNLHGKLTDTSGTALSGEYNMTFTIYDALTGGNALWQVINQTITADTNGIYTTILSGVNTTFENQLYLGIKIGNDDESLPRLNLTSTAYSFRARIADSINTTNDYEMNSLNLSGNLNVTENVTAQYFIGDGSFLTNINVDGDVRLGSHNISSTDVNISNGTNTNFFFDYDTGSIGVWTGSPAATAALHVAGNIRSGAGTISRPAVQIGDDSGLYLPSNDEIGIITGGSERIRIQSDGDVGIGVTTPSDVLEIQKDNSGGLTAIRVTNEGGILNSATGIRFFSDDTGGIDFEAARIQTLLKNDADGSEQADLQFSTIYSGSLVDAVYITNGNVGIGTTTPNEALSIKSSAPANNINLYINETSDFGGLGIDSQSQSHIRFFEKGSTKWQIRTGSNVNGNFRIYDFGSATDVLTIENVTGNVGIGVASPTERFEINNSDTTIFTAPIVGAYNAESHGIALTNYFAGGTGSYTGVRMATGDGTSNLFSGMIGLVDEDGGGGLTGRMFFATRDSTTYSLMERLVIDEVGFVGMGISNPVAELHINATNTPQIKLSDSFGHGQIEVNSGHFDFFANSAYNQSINFLIWDGSQQILGMKIGSTGQIYIKDVNTGSNAGTDLCIDVNGEICACGSCA